VSAEEGGDEPVLLAALLPGVAVLAGESRAEAGRECLRRQNVEVFLLDDGYQHLSLRRDADLLLVDAGRGLGNRHTLPLGPLREPPRNARFADALVVTRCAGLAQGEKTAAAVPFPAERPRAFSRLVPRSLVDRRGGNRPSRGSRRRWPQRAGLNDQPAAARESRFVSEIPGERDHRYRP
jgi:tetraacyldisaccharide-1-P 4'-kinase